MVKDIYLDSRIFCERNNININEFNDNMKDMLDHYRIYDKKYLRDYRDKLDQDYYYKIHILVEPLIVLMLNTYKKNPLYKSFGNLNKKAYDEKISNISIDDIIEYNHILINKIDELPPYFRYELKQKSFYNINIRLNKTIPMIIDRFTVILSKQILETNIDAGNIYDYLTTFLENQIEGYNQEANEHNRIIEIEGLRGLYSIEQNIVDIFIEYIKYIKYIDNMDTEKYEIDLNNRNTYEVRLEILNYIYNKCKLEESKDIYSDLKYLELEIDLNEYIIDRELKNSKAINEYGYIHVYKMVNWVYGQIIYLYYHQNEFDLNHALESIDNIYGIKNKKIIKCIKGEIINLFDDEGNNKYLSNIELAFSNEIKNKLLKISEKIYSENMHLSFFKYKDKRFYFEKRLAVSDKIDEADREVRDSLSKSMGQVYLNKINYKGVGD